MFCKELTFSFSTVSRSAPIFACLAEFSLAIHIFRYLPSGSA
jgi:hypothetical protein